MKKYLRIISIIVVALVSMGAVMVDCMQQDVKNKTIDKLWKEYYKAVEDDLPKEELKILGKLKKIAYTGGAWWDYYEAGGLYVNVSSSINWKDREKESEKWAKEILACPYPLVPIYYRMENHQMEGLLEEVHAHKSELETSSVKGFYREGIVFSSYKFAEAMPALMRNDYDYVLWGLAFRGMNVSAREELSERLGDNYPLSAILEYMSIRSGFDRKHDDTGGDKSELYRAYVAKYEGRAVALLAEEDLLNKRFDELKKSDTGSEKYRELRSDIADFEKRRKAFRGNEALLANCCIEASALADMLDDHGIGASIRDGVLTLRLTNVDKVEFRLNDADDKVVLREDFDNPIKSYYIQDTITYRLPNINDGCYTVHCSGNGTTSDFIYERHTLSLAQKRDTRGYAVYVADYLSGKPIDKADISLYDSKGKLIQTCENIALDGFTYLPDSLFAGDAKVSRMLASLRTADGLFRSSDDIYLSNSVSDSEESSSESLLAVTVKDCSAFNPGDSVNFKSVLYSRDEKGVCKTVGSGREVKVELCDSQANVVATKILSTNDFGSVSSSFELEKSARNGQYSINVSCGDKLLDITYLRVDDFVLPSFELNFVKSSKLYLSGDMVAVDGTVMSYSGYNLSSANASYTVETWGKVVEQGQLDVSPDGSFRIEFQSDGSARYTYYTVKVRVVDSTGETLEWSEGVAVSSELPLSVKILNPQKDVQCAEFENVLNTDKLVLSFVVNDSWSDMSLEREHLFIAYSVFCKDKEIRRGIASGGDTVEVDLRNFPSGEYTVKAEASANVASGEIHTVKRELRFLKLKDDDVDLDADVENLFRVIPSTGIHVQMGATRGPVWACMDIYGAGSRPLISQRLYLEAVRGGIGSLHNIKFDYGEDWGDVVTLKVFYFRGGRSYCYTHEFRAHSVEPDSLPLSFTRFFDRTLPNHAYNFIFHTSPDAECVAAIFDKSTETMMHNGWSEVYRPVQPAPSVDYSVSVGHDGGQDYAHLAYGRAMRSAAGVRFKGRSSAPEMMVLEDAVEEYASLATNAAGQEVSVRKDFSTVLAFEPFMHPDANGDVKLNFRTADKLSTFVVSLFAHNKSMDNAVLRRQMVVSLPVQLSTAFPQYLYSGDKYTVKAALRSAVNEPIAGVVYVDVYPGRDYSELKPIKSYSSRVNVAASGSASVEFALLVPQVSDLGVKVSFVPDTSADVADAVFDCIPVFAPSQRLKEAHSALLRSSGHSSELVDSLRAQFVNLDASTADVKVRTLLDIVKDAVPQKMDIDGCRDVLSLSDALYSYMLAVKCGMETDGVVCEEIVKKILDCNNADGGFAWFAGMKSSPLITAAVLGRIAALREHGLVISQLLDVQISAAVKYLDDNVFMNRDLPRWCGALSLEQYLYVRSYFTEYPINLTSVKHAVYNKFQRDVKSYLVPSKGTGQTLGILAKARRAAVLQRLRRDDDGIAFAKSLGVRLRTVARIEKCLNSDLNSLCDYAVEHRSGGIYFPNAVMPWRGLLGSELYAHVLLCDLMRDCGDTRISDGLRLWMMVQKETQSWDNDPAYMDALASVLDGTDEMLNMKVVSLVATGENPFSKIAASGNGFSIERKYLVERVVDGERKYLPLNDGDIISVGDKIRAEYSIWNEENRSFVRVSAPRPACLRPVNQLSGHLGWWLGPLMVRGYALMPQGYCSVLSDRTEYWFDTYPEEKTSLSEDFFVTQEGIFQQGVVEIESLYAPHYRACDSTLAPLCSNGGA